MKLIAVSDLHSDVAAAKAVVKAARGADVVIAAGDFGTRGLGAADVLDILRALSCPLVFVHGNHDDLSDMAAWDGAHYLHGSGVEIAGVPFYGAGGETPVSNEAAWNVAQSEAEMARLLAGCPAGAVLVTHAPPFGVCDVQKGGAHEGSAAIAACVEAKQPRLVLSGHIHNAWGMRGVIGASPVANVGPKAVEFTL